MAIVAKTVVVTGRVQGVWFRAWTAKAAGELGLRGWVRNRHDGSVEALVQGEADAVAHMLARFWEGSPASKVESVEASDAAASDLSGFEQRPDV